MSDALVEGGYKVRSCLFPTGGLLYCPTFNWTAELCFATPLPVPPVADLLLTSRIPTLVREGAAFSCFDLVVED